MEVEDTYLRLDKDIERLLHFLDEKVGRGEYLVFLTADHGANEALGYQETLRMPGKQYNEEELQAWLEAKINKQFGAGNWIHSVSNYQVYLNRKLVREKRLNQEILQLAVADMLLEFDGIAMAMSARRLLESNQDATNPIRLGYHAKRSGDVIFQLLPGWMDYEVWGTSHGSGYTYDTHVPLIWYGTGITSGSDVNYTRITQIAPTLSFLLGIPLPSGSDPNPVLPLFVSPIQAKQ